MRYSSLSAVTTTTARRQGPPGSHRVCDTWATSLVMAQKVFRFKALVFAVQEGVVARHTSSRRYGTQDKSSSGAGFPELGRQTHLLVVSPSASCHVNPQGSRPKPQSPDLFVPRPTSTLQIYQPLAQRLPAQLREQPAQATATPSDSSFLFFCASTPDVCAIKSKHTRHFRLSATDEPLFGGFIGHRTTLSKEPGRP